jgi:multiple sugar transport system ATP-binding protein
MTTVSFVEVTKRFDDVVALDHLDLEVAAGEFLVLVGPSGCGKSTALRLIAGLEEVSSGTLRIGGVDVTDVEPQDRDLAMVFQSYALYPHKSVQANIEFPLKSRGVAKADRRRAAGEVAEMLGLGDLLGRRPSQLSGGQRQRVALARALVRRPQVFLMDEPLSNLDAKTRVHTRTELSELHSDLGATFIYVTHDQVEAMTMGTRIAVLSDGRLQQVGPPDEVYRRPANLFVAGFVGSPPMNTLPATVHAGPGEGRLVVGASAVALGPELARTVGERREVVLGVRPEHVRIGSGDLAGTVRLVESLGHERHIVCELDEVPATDPVIVRQSADEPAPVVGDAVVLGAAVEHLHLFDPTTTARIGP